MQLTISKLSDKEISYLMRLYNEQPLGMDKLPYTEEFNSMVGSFQSVFGTDYGHQKLWRTLVNLRKQKKLMRKSRTR
jgi:predicted TIM-barrel fold metal-dependent hydrolase